MVAILMLQPWPMGMELVLPQEGLSPRLAANASRRLGVVSLFPKCKQASLCFGILIFQTQFPGKV